MPSTRCPTSTLQATSCPRLVGSLVPTRPAAWNSGLTPCESNHEFRERLGCESPPTESAHLTKTLGYVSFGRCGKGVSRTVSNCTRSKTANPTSSCCWVQNTDVVVGTCRRTMQQNQLRALQVLDWGIRFKRMSCSCVSRRGSEFDASFVGRDLPRQTMRHPFKHVNHDCTAAGSVPDLRLAHLIQDPATVPQCVLNISIPIPDCCCIGSNEESLDVPWLWAASNAPCWWEHNNDIILSTQPTTSCGMR